MSNHFPVSHTWRSTSRRCCPEAVLSARPTFMPSPLAAEISKRARQMLEPVLKSLDISADLLFLQLD
eukprot:107001-Hanusia_phi.AAC.1